MIKLLKRKLLSKKISLIYPIHSISIYLGVINIYFITVYLFKNIILLGDL